MTASAEFVADLHIHSRYAYACSKNLTLDALSRMAKVKGIGLLATGDFTHPAWLAELEGGLTEVDYGTYCHGGVSFVLGTEVSCVFRQGGRSRRVHLLLFLPSFETVRSFSQELSRRGAKLEGDGRPVVKMTAADLASLALEVDAGAVIIPAHVWTPWYGMLGSVSGFDSLQECFGDLAPEVRAVETGLSSDPLMNWGIPEFSGRAIVSFSDAHSLPNLGRELTVFRGQASYQGFSEAIRRNDVAYTAEFYPEEGKYHYNGHRKCGVRQSPAETLAQTSPDCPVCGRPLTLGVLHRARSMSAGGDPAAVERARPGPDGLISSREGHPPFRRLVPLNEVISAALGVGPRSKAVERVHRDLCAELGSELRVLVNADEASLQRVAGERVAAAVVNVRRGQVVIDPGFDGQYGAVRAVRVEDQ